jgi:hypothetical protein
MFDGSIQPKSLREMFWKILEAVLQHCTIFVFLELGVIWELERHKSRHACVAGAGAPHASGHTSDQRHLRQPNQPCGPGMTLAR